MHACMQISAMRQAASTRGCKATALHMCLAKLSAVTCPRSVLARAETEPTRSSVLRHTLLLAVTAQIPVASAHGYTQMSASNSSVTLRTGSAIPAVGLGVFLAKSGKETYDAVLSSLNLGYRHVDTARMYGNEADVGKAIKDSGIPRQNVFVTSKIFDVDWGYDAAVDAINDSLASVGMQYLDLMLMHHPGEPHGRKETWQALEDAHQQVQALSRPCSQTSNGCLKCLNQAACQAAGFVQKHWGQQLWHWTS